MAVDTRKKSKLTRWAVGTLLGAGLCAWAFWPVQTARIFRTGLLPVRMLAARTWDGWDQLWEAPGRVRELEEENARLVSQLAQAQQSLAGLESRTGLEALEQQFPQLELAELWLVGRDPALGARFWVALAQGGSVPEGMAVVDRQGYLVGITGKGEEQGLVLPLADPDFSVPCWAGESRESGWVTGREGKAALTDLPRDTPAKEGDLVMTSGLSGEIPQGIPVGILETPELDPASGTRTADLTPLGDREGERCFYLVTGVKNG